MNPKPPENQPAPFDLELVETDRLIEELINRTDCLVMAWTRGTGTDNDANFRAVVQGNLFTCQGLATYLADHCIDTLP